MPIILQDDFSTFNTTIWPTYIHTSGSYAVSAGAGVFTPGSGGLDSLGIKSEEFLWDAGSTLSINFLPSSLSSCNYIISLATTGHTYGYSGTYGCYVDGGSPPTYVWDVNASHSISSGFTPSTVSYNTLTFQARGDFLIDMYLNGALRYTSINLGSGFDTSGNLMSLEFHVDQVNGSSGTLSIQSFVVNNNQNLVLQQSLTSGSGFSTIATPNLGVETYGDSGLIASTPYYYREAMSVNGALSNYSNEASVTTQAIPSDDANALLLEILT